MLNLYFVPSTASMVPHILLEELGVPFQLTRVDRENNAHKAPDYLRLNPNGRIPVLVDGALVLYETAAITLHLCDGHPTASLLPEVGTHERAHAYKWLMWLTNTLQTALMAYFYPERLLPRPDPSASALIREQAERQVSQLLGQLDAELARHGGPWFMGVAYTALDAYVFTLCRWTRGFAHERPAREWPHLGPYLQRMLARPAVLRMLATEALPQPWV